MYLYIYIYIIIIECSHVLATYFYYYSEQVENRSNGLWANDSTFVNAFNDTCEKLYVNLYQTNKDKEMISFVKAKRDFQKHVDLFGSREAAIENGFFEPYTPANYKHLTKLILVQILYIYIYIYYIYAGIYF